MLADAWHECKERKLFQGVGPADIPIRIPGILPLRLNKWVIMVWNEKSETDTEVPVAFCPWCGLDLKKADSSRHLTIHRNTGG